jgi:hypothetical protein
VDGLTPAVWVGAVVVALGALAALAVPPLRRRSQASVGAPVLAGAEAEPAA